MNRLYTVLLLRTFSDNDGDTYIAHVVAMTTSGATDLAIREAIFADTGEVYDDGDLDNYNSYMPLLVLNGHHEGAEI